jgi:hypothetical protein
MKLTNVYRPNGRPYLVKRDTSMPRKTVSLRPSARMGDYVGVQIPDKLEEYKPVSHRYLSDYYGAT